MNQQLTLRQVSQYLFQDAPAWLRWVIGVGLLFINTVVALYAAQRQLTLLLFPLLGIALILVFLRWPAVGLIVAALSGIIVPYLGPSGFNVTMVLVSLLIGLWFLKTIVQQDTFWLAPSSTVWLIFVFVGLSLFSFAVGQLPWFTFAENAPLGAQLGGLSIYILSAGVYLLMASQVREMVWLQRMTFAFLAFGALTMLTNIVLPNLGLVSGTMLQPVGPVFYIWLVALAFSQALYNRDLHPGWRLALLAMVLANIYFHFFIRYEHKSTWFSLAACLAIIIGLRSWRAAIAVGLVGLLSIFYMANSVILSEEYSLFTRFEGWTILFQIMKASPVWGLGFANYYWYTPLFPIRGYEVSFNSHNNYIDIAAQVGILGLICILVLFWQLFRTGWRLRKSAPAGFAQAYAYGALGGLSGMAVVGMLGDWFLPFFYNVGLAGFRSSMLGWLFLGGLVSLEHIVKSLKAPS